MHFQAPYAFIRYALTGFILAAAFLVMAVSGYTFLKEMPIQYHLYFGLGFIVIGIIHLKIYFVYVKAIDSDGIKRSYSRKAFYANEVTPETFSRIHHVYADRIAKIERIKEHIAYFLVGIVLIATTLFELSGDKPDTKKLVPIAVFFIIFIVAGLLRLIFRGKNKQDYVGNIFGETYYMFENQEQPHHYEYSPNKQVDKLNILLILFSFVVIALLWVGLFFGGFSTPSIVIGIILTASIIAYTSVFNLRPQNKRREVIHSDM